MSQAKTIRGLTFGEGMPKICVPLMGKTEEEVLKAVPAILASGADLVEWRADHLLEGKNPQAVRTLLFHLRPLLSSTPLLFTFRTAAEGGMQAVSLDEYLRLLKMVAASGFVDLVDLEGMIPGHANRHVAQKLQELGVSVVVSSHDFEKTLPEQELYERLLQLEQQGGDFVKLAVMPRTPQDVEALLSATRRYTARPEAALAITMSMGELGVRSRVIGEETGSVLTFGAVGQTSAPGQLAVSELRSRLLAVHAARVREA